MTQDGREIEQRIADATSSEHAIAIFHTWKQCASRCTWNRARIERGEGLTLCYDQDESITIELRFTHTDCGFDGVGPRAAFTILTEAGFEVISPAAMWMNIIGNNYCEFRRSM